jgi:hypothetical protein
VTGQGLTGGVCGFNDATAASVCPTNDYAWQDVIDVGANYLNKFGTISVAAYGAFLYSSFVPGFGQLARVANLNNGSNVTAWKQWVVGLQLGFDGLFVGGAVGYDNNGLGSNYYTGIDNYTRFYTGGIMYENGPWQFSAGWVGARNTNGNGSPSILALQGGTSAATFNTSPGAFVPSTAQSFGTNLTTGALLFGRETADEIEVGVNYALGPGIRLVGGFLYYSLNGPSNAVVGNSWAFVLGTELRF